MVSHSDDCNRDYHVTRRRENLRNPLRDIPQQPALRAIRQPVEE